MRFAPKLVWTAVPALVALAAALDAHAITTLVGVRLAPDPDALAASRRDPGEGKAAPDPSPPSADPILARNPFDHLTSLLPTTPSAYDPNGPTASTDPRDAPPCEELRVVAIAASSDP